MMARRKKKKTTPVESHQDHPMPEQETPSPVDTESTAPEGQTPTGSEGQPQPPDVSAPPEEDGAETASSPAEEAVAQARIAELEAALADAQQQVQEYLAGWQRERAAFANYKRRMAEQQDQQRRQLLAEVVKDFLEVLDDLELALQKRPSEGEGAVWAEGVDLIYRKLRQKLEAKGVEQVPAEPGMPFDPRYHEAVAYEPVDGQESGHIVEVLRAGYRIGDWVIRPALVRVAQ